MTITCDRRASHQRRRALDDYFTANVLAGGFVCAHKSECKRSHPGTFLEGQLHHVGQFYDLLLDRSPLRVVIVGQEYGHGPAQVDSHHRHAMIMDSGTQCRFEAEPGHKGRNPHMRGTTSALRLLFGIPLGSDYESESVPIDGERVHLFDAFALVNYLLCSAVAEDSRSRGLATPTMKKSCRHHFREALRILEPTVVVVQGKNFWPWVQDAFDSVNRIHRSHPVHAARLGSMQALVASFTHPSARYPSNWGMNDRTPYLLEVVAPSLAWIRNRILRRR